MIMAIYYNLSWNIITQSLFISSICNFLTVKTIVKTLNKLEKMLVIRILIYFLINLSIKVVQHNKRKLNNIVILEAFTLFNLVANLFCSEFLSESINKFILFAIDFVPLYNHLLRYCLVSSAICRLCIKIRCNEYSILNYFNNISDFSNY